MDSKELGKRIKELRLAQKMTQSDLVGDFITRSMLSQIEHGTAVPSMRTLDYIARKLRIAVSDLVPDQSDAIDCLIYAKRALSSDDFELALEYAESFSPALEDEACIIRAKSHLELAKTYVSRRQYETAADHARAAASFAEKGVYASRHIKADALLILDEASRR